MQRRHWLALVGTIGVVWLAAGQTGDAAKERPMAEQQEPKPADGQPMPPLTPEEAYVIRQKGTERPFTGKYWDTYTPGLYVCRQCGAALYESTSKFRSDCGWPSFDDEIPFAVKHQTDADGQRTEILCARCGGHLGHVFQGERFTPKNTRHCVNSLSITLRPSGAPVSQALFAGGCFWGVEHHLEGVPGVLSVESGYTGGTVAQPSYEQVCTGRTGHAETVRIIFDPSKVTYEQLAKTFFELHDPTTLNSQGPDVGSQYRSAVFYRDDAQKQTVDKLIGQLKGLGYDVVTEVKPAGPFYTAEEYHQDYLTRHPGGYDCHVRVPRFEQKAH